MSARSIALTPPEFDSILTQNYSFFDESGQLRTDELYVVAEKAHKVVSALRRRVMDASSHVREGRVSLDNSACQFENYQQHALMIDQLIQKINEVVGDLKRIRPSFDLNAEHNERGLVKSPESLDRYIDNLEIDRDRIRREYDSELYSQKLSDCLRSFQEAISARKAHLEAEVRARLRHQQEVEQIAADFTVIND